MRIVLDTRSLETDHRYRGIGVYTQNIIQNLLKIDKNNTYLFMGNTKPNSGRKISPESAKFEEILIRENIDSSRYHWLSDQYFVPLAVLRGKVDMVHYLDQLSVPLIKTKPVIITVHDLYQYVQGETGFKIKIRLQPLKYADILIVPSIFSQKELIHHFNIDIKKIKVIPHGYNRELFYPAHKKTKKSPKYLLYIGIIGEKRKNLEFLIDVFGEIAKDHPDIILKIVGKSGPGAGQIKQKIKDLKLNERVKIINFAENITEVYQNAEIFLFPSLYEGFGLPPLEAMACGIPVISSNTTSLPEVVGNGGVLLSPTDKYAWVKAIKKILSDASYRDGLINKGRVQAQKFSWEKSAKETIRVYNQISRK